MNIQAINFKTPVIKTNLSFRDRDIQVDKYGAAQDVFIRHTSEFDPKKEFKGRQIQADSLNVLSWANKMQKEAKRKYAEAKKIHRTWQKERSHILVEDDAFREFVVNEGIMNVYKEKKSDGTRRIIKYIFERPTTLEEISPDGKWNIYSFDIDGELAHLVEGKYKETSEKEIKITIEGTYFFSLDGHLESYSKNHQMLYVFDKQQDSKRSKETIDIHMLFDVAGKKPYLKEAQSGILNDGFRTVESSFKYDENGNLIEAK